jgi:glycosyltransferase involved in cell wall biosynthesis
MAIPVVATRHSGIPEGVREGVTAELVDEKDVPTLAEKLRSFLQDPVKARAFGEAGRRFVSDNFDLRAQVSGLEEIYTRLIAKRASSL